MPEILCTAEVVFPGVEGSYSYRIPARLGGTLRPGMRVLAPFGHRRVTGTVINTSSAENEKATREFENVLDEEPVFSPALLKFTRWVADYYLCPWGDVLKAALPAGTTLDEKRHWVLSLPRNDLRVEQFCAAHPDALPVIEALGESSLSPERMKKLFDLGANSTLLRWFQEQGIAAYRPVLKPPRVKSQFDSVVTLSPTAQAQYGPEFIGHLRSVHEQHLLREIFESGPEGVLRSDLLKSTNSARRQAFSRLLASGHVELRVEEVTRWNAGAEAAPHTVEPEVLTDEQNVAIAATVGALNAHLFKPFLLYGVTGSGKTQVYIESIRHALAQGQSALVLLPEIALTPFVWGRFYQAFGDRVAIQHSAQSPSVRYDLWRDIKSGKYPVVVGARSAVFAPLNNLGLIVVDEEQESSFKQEEPPPRYHARDAALVRAQMESAVIVLGSATPSVESFYNVRLGRYEMLTLPHRVGGAFMPNVSVVQRSVKIAPEPEDTDEKKSKRKKPVIVEPPILTDDLVTLLEGTLARGRQAILLQNRRGFAPFLICKTCGTIPMCPNCSVSLTYHRKGLSLRCHYCDHREAAPESCPKCGSLEWSTSGLGTQRLEEELAVRFPEARILRMDSDTTSRRGMHGKMVSAFAAGEYDLLVGTQMVAKGLDFPNVELAAVVQAETELFYPDFRASERGASLVVQTSGRAGRRAETGTVIIQSTVAEHPVLSFALKGDWEAFVEQELISREKSNFPPFSRLILLRAVAKEETSCARALLRLRRLLQQNASGINVLGPAPAVVTKVRTQFRYHLLVRSPRSSDPSGTALRQAVKSALSEYKKAKGEPGVTIEVDVDPQSVT